MKRAHLIAAAALVGGAFLGLRPAQAAPISVVWNFDSPTGNLGTTQSYSSTPPLVPPENIIASGFSPQGNHWTAQNLFGKNAGAGEQGLGLTNDPTGDGEITHGSFVQLDLSQLHSPPLLSMTLSFAAGSTTPPDEWGVYGTNSAGTLNGATLIDSGFNDNLVSALPGTIIGTYRYIDVTELSTMPNANILLQEVDNSIASPSVPEPASLALIGVGLLGLGLVRRRKS